MQLLNAFCCWWFYDERLANDGKTGFKVSTMNVSHFLPDTLAGLRNVLSHIEQEHYEVRLGRRSRTVLRKMLEAPQQVAVSSIGELALKFGVNPSTLSRLSQRLGYEKYSQLQELFRREMLEGQHFYSAQADELLKQVDSEPRKLLALLAQQETANMASLVERVNPADFDAAAHLILHSKRVRIHGMRQFYSLSHFFSYALGMLRQDVAPFDAGREGVADALAQLQADDLLIVVSCFPYTQSVLRTADIASRRGIKVIALTDSTSSPLVASANYSFFVPNQSAFFSNSMCGFMLLSEGLLNRVAGLMGNDALVSLRQREALIEQMAGSL
jgi:DNA-binding MurR/RpiR family transcriptional regulator